MNTLVDHPLYRGGLFLLLLLTAALIVPPAAAQTKRAAAHHTLLQKMAQIDGLPEDLRAAPVHRRLRAALDRAVQEKPIAEATASKRFRAAVNPLLAAAADEARLIADDGVVGDAFGWSVSIDGDRALVGAPFANSFQGAAYVFEFDGTSWTEQAKLKATDGAAFDVFGWSVSLDGDRALVSASWDDSFRGGVYVFEFDGAAWNQDVKLTAADGLAFDEFGQSVSLDGDQALIGAYGVQGFTGAAYVFDADGGSWTEQAKLLPGDLEAGDNFGVSVSLDGERALVGASAEDENGSAAGAAYGFAFTSGSWTVQDKLTALDGDAMDFFGEAVSLNGDRALIGATLDEDNGTGAGSAYIFAFDGAAWNQQAKLLAEPGGAFGDFGTAVSLSGDRALVGAVGADNAVGAAFAFDGAAWTQQDKLTPSDGVTFDFYGQAVSIEGDRTIVGSPGNNGGTGAAYAFASDDALPPLPHPYLFLADLKIKIDGHIGSAGDIHSNRDIEFKKGDPSTYTGTVTAVRNVKIDKDNTVDGDVTAGGSVQLKGNASVTGTVTEGAAVAPIPLPALDPFTAGTANVQVPKDGNLTLAPGAYRDVEVDKDGVLYLSSGVYYFRKLELKDGAVVSFDVADGPVTVNVVEEIDFRKEAEVAITPLGEAGTRYVTFNLLGDQEIGVDKDARLLGNVIAPSAKVHLKKDGFFRGAICAREIDVDQGATLLQHDASLPAMQASEQAAPAQTATVPAEAASAQETPEGYRLASNYPNPFNPVTTIAFALPEATPVRLVVYDVTGRVAAHLVEGPMAAGSHQVQFDASGLPSGVYLYQLTAGPFTETRRMVLIK